MIVKLEEVCKSYGAQDVLRGVTMQVNPGEHLGLVGRNGAGKTTIFRLIAGLEEQDTGQVALQRGVRVGMLAQQPVFSGARTVREEALEVLTEILRLEGEMERLEHLMAELTGAALEQTMHEYSDLRHRYEVCGGFTYGARVDSVLGGLGFRGDDLGRHADELSGGQKARLALARLLLAEPDLLLLDEPTNHLDMSAVEWLEEFLAQYRQALVIVSHDRFLLDRIVTGIVELDGGLTTSYPGNYSAYLRQRDERRLTQSRQFRQQQEMIARAEEFIRRNIAGQKTKQAKSRRKMLDRLERVEAISEDRVSSFGLAEPASGKRRRLDSNAAGVVLSAADLAVGYGCLAVTTGLSFNLQRGARLGIIGGNGSGKTTFLRTVMGAIAPVSGGFSWSATARPGYYDQELSDLDPGLTVMEELSSSWRRPGTGLQASASAASLEGELRAFLARFLFFGDDVFKPVSALSGGERSRLALAKLVSSRANILLLDEPTNHLDIPSREALEQSLAEYAGTIIAVSHDRYFLDKIASEILAFENGAATHYPGSYSEYYATRQTERQFDETGASQLARRRAKRARPARQPAREPSRGRRPLDIENEIFALEHELAELSNKLSSPASEWGPDQFAEMGTRHEAIASRLNLLYKEWESAGAEAAELE